MFRGPITTANVVLRPEEVIRSDAGGNDDMYPKFSVESVTMKVDEESTTVSVFGEVPLFKTKKFEDALKKWLAIETQRTLVPQIKQHFFDIEDTIWTHIPFEY
jgi:hypothetical protein